MSVRELMRLDAAQALDHARQGFAARPRDQAAVTQSGELQLLAIYGVGKKLLARIRHGDRTFLYIRGNALPVGVKADRSQSVFRLMGISSSCVELARAEKARTLCLHPSLWSGG